MLWSLPLVPLVLAADPVEVKARVEIEARRADHVEVLPRGADGFLVISQDADYRNGTIHRYGADFVESASWALPADTLYRPCPHDAHSNPARLCFFGPRTGLHIVTVPEGQGDLAIRDFELSRRWVNGSAWTDDGLWIVNGAGESWERPVPKAELVRVDLGTGLVRTVDATVPGPGKTFLQAFHQTTDGATWVESGRKKGSKQRLALPALSPEGTPTRYELPDPGEKNLLSAAVAEQGAQGRILAGSYGARKGDITADGLWIAPLDGRQAGPATFVSL